jgi:hypothetical protein
MSTDRDTVRILESWLAEPAHEDHYPVVSRVLDSLDDTPQYRPWWPVRRFLTMTPTTRLAASAAALTIIIGLGFLASRTLVGPEPAASPNPTEAAVETSVHTVDLGNVTATLAIPTGWTQFSDFAFQKSQALPPGGVGVGITMVDNVYADPCRWRGEGLLQPPIGASVESLAHRLTQQPGRGDVSRTSTSLDGFDGELVELQVPGDITTCDDSIFASWLIRHRLHPQGLPRLHQGPGQHDRLWILDVGGERVVVNASFFPDSSAADLAELDAVVESIRFELAPATPPPSNANPDPHGDASPLFPESLYSGGLYRGWRHRDLAAGSYVVDDFPLRITLRVPDGWYAGEFSGLLPSALDLGKRGSTANGNLLLTIWALDEPPADGVDPPGVAVLSDRCAPGPVELRSEVGEIGATARDLAQALAELAVSRSPEPVLVDVDGFDAWWVRLAMPSLVGSCHSGFMEPWVGTGSAWHMHSRPGDATQRVDIWVVDAYDLRLVIEGRYLPGASDADLAELAGVIASLRIESHD